MKRYFQVVATGQWLGPVFQDVAFAANSGQRMANRVAETFGLPSGALIAIDTEDNAPDPRMGTLLAEVIPPPPPPTEDELRLQADRTEGGALASFVAANPDPATWTNAQLREALIRLIRSTLRRHRLI